jgi:hypothetical protein
MRKLIAAILVASSTLLAGCAGTSAIVQSEYRLAQGEKLKLQLNAPPTASEERVTILRERLATQLSSNALLAGSSDASSRTIDVTVTNYRLRHGATRALVGIMAGADNIQSTVQVKDSSTGKVLSEFKVESKNPSAWGTSKGMIEEHADKIVEIPKNAKR